MTKYGYWYTFLGGNLATWNWGIFPKSSNQSPVTFRWFQNITGRCQYPLQLRHFENTIFIQSVISLDEILQQITKLLVQHPPFSALLSSLKEHRCTAQFPNYFFFFLAVHIYIQITQKQHEIARTKQHKRIISCPSEISAVTFPFNYFRVHISALNWTSGKKESLNLFCSSFPH